MNTTARTCPNCKTPLPGVAAFCYACGEATPAGIDLHTGERIAITKSGMTRADLHIRLQHFLGESYNLGERIGQGGFAEVYQAHDLRLKRDVAVKVLRPDVGLTAGMLERFRLEAEVIAGIRHPNIVPIYDIGEGHGIAYLIMPLIDGCSLRQFIEREKSIPLVESIRILREAADGLGAAHAAGVIHRDVKPENIMLDGAERRVMLMDFGIAKAVGVDSGSTDDDDGVSMTLTSTGIIVGTPQYMSPEQASGDKSIDARTDQYSLAVVGYRLLSGTLPFTGESTRAVLFKQLVTDPDPLEEKVKDLPAGLSDIIGRALSKEPSERFADMREFARALKSSTAILGTGTQPAYKGSVGKQQKAPKGKKTAGKAKPVSGKSVAASKSADRKQAKAAVTDFLAAPPKRRVLVLGGVAAVATIALVSTMMSGSGDNGLNDDFTPRSALGFDNLDSLSTAARSDSSMLAEVTPTRPRTRPQTTVSRGTPPPPAAASVDPSISDQVAAEPTCGELVSSASWSAALTACTAAAEAESDPVAMRLLGTMYRDGNGVPADDAEAFAWFLKAGPNDGAASFELSRMYEQGIGTSQDLAANVRTLRVAARLGHQQATLTLAQRLEDGSGEGIDRDYEEAAVWYSRAAGRGSVLAMMRMADFAQRGRGMDKDEALAVDWFRKAADAGSGEGAWQAAEAYLKGEGVPVNVPLGMQLLRRAAELGNDEAIEELADREG